MKVIYVAGPFTSEFRHGVEENIRNAEDWAIRIAKLGALPVTPHANTRRPEFEVVQPYTFWIEATLELMYRCDAAFFIPGWEKSRGATGEYQKAKERGMPVFLGSLALLGKWLESGELTTPCTFCHGTGYLGDPSNFSTRRCNYCMAGRLA